MKVVYITESVEGPALQEGEMPIPQPGVGELLIEVHAAGLTTTELLWYPSTHRKDGEKRVKPVPGHEFSGVVREVGKDVGRLEIGLEVFGMNDWFAEGAFAEYCLTHFSSVVPKPAGVTDVEAASLPIAGLTAWQALDRVALRAGERILVHGGAGAVGAIAVQLARLRGAHVIATAAARNHDFVAGLGAEEVLDYQAAPFESSVSGVDVVFDTVGGETLQRSWAVLNRSGRLVTIAADAESSIDPRTKAAFLLVEPNQYQLGAVGQLVASKRLRPVVDRVVPLARVADAYTGRLPRQGRGKVVMKIAAQAAEGALDDQQ